MAEAPNALLPKPPKAGLLAGVLPLPLPKPLVFWEVVPKRPPPCVGAGVLLGVVAFEFWDPPKRPPGVGAGVLLGVVALEFWDPPKRPPDCADAGLLAEFCG